MKIWTYSVKLLELNLSIVTAKSKKYSNLVLKLDIIVIVINSVVDHYNHYVTRNIPIKTNEQTALTTAWGKTIDNTKLYQHELITGIY